MLGGARDYRTCRDEGASFRRLSPQDDAATHYTMLADRSLAVWIVYLKSNASAVPRVALVILLIGGRVGGFMGRRTFWG